MDDNLTATIEKTLFEESSEFKDMIGVTTKRLGFTETLTLGSPKIFVEGAFKKIS